MSRDFSFTALLNTESMKEANRKGYTEKVSIYDIDPSDDNFYSTAQVENLKDSLLLVGLQQPVVVNMSHDEDGRKYRMIAGHRRLKACTELAAEGFEEFKEIPAIICDVTDPDEEKAILIMTNSTQRELTSWEKVNQYMELKPVIKSLMRKENLHGKARTIASETLGVKESQIGNYNLIGTKLISPLMYMFKADKITMELALEAAQKLSEEEQEELAFECSEAGTFTKADIYSIISKRIIPGQQSFVDNVDNNNIVTDTVDNNNPVSGNENNGFDNNSCEDEPIGNEMELESESGEYTIQADEETDEIADMETEAAVEDTKPKAADRYDTLSVVRKLIAQYDELVHRHTRSDKDFEIKCILDALVLYEAQFGKTY